MQMGNNMKHSTGWKLHQIVNIFHPRLLKNL